MKACKVSDDDLKEAPGDEKQVTEAKARLLALTVPDFILLAGSRPSVSFEASCLPSLKWSIEGTKLVLLWSFSALGNHVRKLLGRVAQKKPISSAATTQWVSAATEAQLRTMLESNPGPDIFYMANVGPGDVMFIPAGYVKLEYPGSTDSLSVRWTALSCLRSAQQPGDLSACVADLTSMGKKNVGLDYWVSYCKTKAQQAKVAGAAVATEDPQLQRCMFLTADLFCPDCFVCLIRAVRARCRPFAVRFGGSATLGQLVCFDLSWFSFRCHFVFGTPNP
jgi:hypothetical protein